MVLIWGANFSVIKRAFEEVPPQPFNALRLLIASAVFLAAIAIARRTAQRGSPISTVFHTAHPLTRRDRIDLVWLGLVGHFGYQFFFVGGVALSSASNAALIVGSTPAVLAVVFEGCANRAAFAAGVAAELAAAGVTPGLVAGASSGAIVAAGVAAIDRPGRGCYRRRTRSLRCSRSPSRKGRSTSRRCWSGSRWSRPPW